MWLAPLFVQEGLASRGNDDDPVRVIADMPDHLKMSRSTIYQYVREKHIPHIRFGKSGLRFRKSDIDRWLEKRSVNGRKKRRPDIR